MNGLPAELERGGFVVGWNRAVALMPFQTVNGLIQRVSAVTGLLVFPPLGFELV